MNRGFTSMLADDLNHLIDLKISLGYSENTYLGRTRQFDRYCATKYAGTGDLTEGIVLSWLKPQPGRFHPGIRYLPEIHWKERLYPAR